MKNWSRCLPLLTLIAGLAAGLVAPIEQAAAQGLNAVYRTNKYAGWTCKQRISGRNVSTTCINDSNSGQSFSSTWAVS